MKNKNNKYRDIDNMTPPKRRRKYYLKNRWIFSVFAMTVVVIVMLVTSYLKQNMAETDYTVAQVFRVIDGDTIDVSLEGEIVRVRMIGIDAPESVSFDEDRNTFWGERASEYTKEHLKEGRIIYLTYDLEMYDNYGRLLAYVWVENEFDNLNSLYQYQMLKDGYAVLFTYKPNTKYVSDLQNAERIAFNDKAGLWAEEAFLNENRIY